MKEDKMRNRPSVTEPLDPDEELSDEEYYEKYLAGREIPYQDETLNAILKKEIMEAADRLEEELDADPSMEGVEPPPEAFEKVMAMAREMEKKKAEENAGPGSSAGPESAGLGSAAGSEGAEPESAEHGKVRPLRPEDYLSEEDRRALEIGRRSMERKRSRRMLRWLGPVAAVFVCVLVVGVSSEANRIRILNAYHVLVGDENVLLIDNEEDYQGISMEEEKDRAEILEKTGMEPVQFLYNPNDLIYDSYKISYGNRRAVLFYKYQGTILTILMVKQDEGIVRGENQDGEVLDTFEVETKIGKIGVQKINGELENKYMAEFLWENTFYKIYGALPKEEFVHMIESLFF